MYGAFTGVLEERLNFKEEKNRDGTARIITEKTENGGKKQLITEGLHLITTVLIFLPFFFTILCVASTVYVYVQT